MFLIFRAFICTALPAKTASGEPFALTGKMVKIGSVRSQVSSLTEIAARHVVTLTKSTGPLSSVAGRLYDFKIDTTAANRSFQPQEIAGITIANDTTVQFVVPPPGYQVFIENLTKLRDGLPVVRDSVSIQHKMDNLLPEEEPIVLAILHYLSLMLERTNSFTPRKAL